MKERVGKGLFHQAGNLRSPIALCGAVAAYSNGTLVVSNRYDHLGRRVQKIAADGTHTFLYDGWRPVVETVAKPGGATDRIEYHWGKDLSGTLDGAAGVGGLLYVKCNDEIYVPFYDAYGNVMGYWDENGAIVAEYAYDAFGRTVAKNGTMADVFSIRYSTKYYDAETGMHYYGRRFYVTALCRWLTRDPIEEQGGVNLYGFCGNNALSFLDKDGRAYFAVRPLGSSPTILRWSDFFTCPFMKVVADAAADYLNIEILHEQLFFEDRNSDLWSIGWGQDNNGRGTYLENELNFGYIKRDSGYNDCVMRIAVGEVNPDHYQLLWFSGFKGKCNCQDYAQALRVKYRELIADVRIRCKCNVK